MHDDDRIKQGGPGRSRAALLLRGAIPLGLAALALLIGPALVVWWLRGGAFTAGDALIGGAISASLLVVGGLALGWAVGRLGRRRR